MLTAVVLGAFSVAPSLAQVPVSTEPVHLTPVLQRDYLVEIGKRPVYASERMLQKMQGRYTPFIASFGEFVQIGKTTVWVPNDQRGAFAQRQRHPYRVATAEAPPSSGRFIQQGKAHIWVPNEG